MIFDSALTRPESRIEEFQNLAAYSIWLKVLPIDTPPYRAAAFGTSDLGTKGGLRTDVDARVLDADGRPIPGPGQLDVFYVGVVDRLTGMILIDSALQGEWDIFWNAVSHMILPALLIGYYSLAYISRMTRSVMLDQLSREYILTARLKGASEFQVVVGQGGHGPADVTGLLGRRRRLRLTHADPPRHAP